MIQKACLSLALLLCASAATAEGYGMRGAELGISKDHVAATGDFRIGPAHSLQMTGALDKMNEQRVGSIVTHLHLEPQPDLRYGFVMGIMDVDERSARAGMIGLSGRHETSFLKMGTSVSAAAAIGQATGSLDFVSLQGDAKIKANDNISFGLGVRAAEFDQTQFDFISWGIDLSSSWKIARSGVELEIRASREGLSGRGGAAPENRLALTASYRFGKDKYRAIPVANPVDQLVRFDKF